MGTVLFQGVPRRTNGASMVPRVLRGPACACAPSNLHCERPTSAASSCGASVCCTYLPCTVDFSDGSAFSFSFACFSFFPPALRNMRLWQSDGTKAFAEQTRRGFAACASPSSRKHGGSMPQRSVLRSEAELPVRTARRPPPAAGRARPCSARCNANNPAEQSRRRVSRRSGYFDGQEPERVRSRQGAAR
jgi:hypothetical protein